MQAERPEFVVAAVAGVTLTKWTRAWDERRTDRVIAVVRVETSLQLAALRAGEVDVAFVRYPFDDEGLSVIPLYEEQPVVVAPKGHAVEAVDDVASSDLHGENLLDDVVRESGWEAAIELVAANVGIVVVPQSIARLFARKDVIARPVTDAPTTRIGLTWVSARTSEDIEDFIGIVRGRTAHSSRSVPTPPSPKPVRRPTQKGSAGSKKSTRQRRRRQGR